jgi:hypothetical protein
VKILKTANNIIQKYIESIQEKINLGEINNIYELLDYLKTEYRANMPEREYEVMSNAVYKHFENYFNEEGPQNDNHINYNPPPRDITMIDKDNL